MRPLILFCCDLMGGVIQVPGVDGRDQGNMRLKLRPACPRNNAFRAKRSGVNFTSIRSLTAEIYPFTAQISPGPFTYSPPTTTKREQRRETRPSPSTTRKVSRLNPSA